ncbi:MAG: hypothetical protein ACM3PP_13125 [Candidatus Saccharibacteria bacterium]
MVFLFWGGALIIALLSWFIWDKRYRKHGLQNLPPGFQKTDEVFIDPVDGTKQRVYYNTENGERHYVEEK